MYDCKTITVPLTACLYTIQRACLINRPFLLLRQTLRDAWPFTLSEVNGIRGSVPTAYFPGRAHRRPIDFEAVPSAPVPIPLFCASVLCR